MKANELMIGDWVQHQEGKCEVLSIHIDGITFWDKKGGGAVSLDRISPIPLTAEILEKNGWKDISDHTLKGCETFKLHYEQRSFDFYITIKLRDYFKLESYDDRFYTLCEMEFGCRFVHELQHALRLCGIDKEIVL